MTAPRRAVVTGTSSGIGQAIAERLLNDGWCVSGLDIAPATIAHPGFGVRALDLADSDAVAAAAAALMWPIHVAALLALGAALLPRMADGGRMVLIGSRAAAGAPGRAEYAATKAALTGLARSRAIELVPRGVTVNVIAPAATDTAMLRDPAREAIPIRLPPSGRLIQPVEIAALAGFLCAAEARAITGQTITVCAGASL